MIIKLTEYKDPAIYTNFFDVVIKKVAVNRDIYLEDLDISPSTYKRVKNHESKRGKLIIEKNSIVSTIEIEKATKETKNLDLVIDETITVVNNKNINMNDVIPEIMGVVESSLENATEIKVPETCPACGSHLVLDGAHYNYDLFHLFYILHYF